MSAPPSALDLDALLAPIPGDNPAGNPSCYAFQLRDELQEMRREERPEDFDQATRPPELKKADWPGVARRSIEVLTSESKDLRVACHLAEALLRTEGYGGLADGLRLIRKLIEECWDRLNPPIDDGDLDSRAEPVANMLDDPQRGICFPLIVKGVELIGPPGQGLGLTAWQQLRAAHTAEADDQLSRALAATEPRRLATIRDELDRCLEELHGLVPALESRLADRAPGLANLAAALEECRFLVNEELGELHPAAVSPSPPEQNTATEPGRPPTRAGGLSAGDAPATRAEVYAQLNRAADLLRELEPHSPIPYLVKRAVRLGRLPYPQLIQKLIRDSNVLDELNREMGINATADEQSPALT